MAQRGPKKEKQPADIRSVLEDNASKLAKSHCVRPGSIVVREAGPKGRQYHLKCSVGGVRVVEGAPREDQPVIELIGSLKEIQGVLSGKKDARAHFLAGGFRLRGDLRYASDIALELGILKEPL